MKGDEVWLEAERAYKRTSHEPERMIQVSRGALYCYCCPVCSSNGVGLLHKSVTSSVLTCYGGYEFE